MVLHQIYEPEEADNLVKGSYLGSATGREPVPGESTGLWGQKCADGRKSARVFSLYNNNILTSIAVWSTLRLRGLLSVCILFNIGTSKSGGCGCMKWSIGDKKMVSIISRPGKEKKTKVTSPHHGLSEKWRDFYLKKYAECCGYSLGSRLLPQILAPQLEQLKRDAGTQKKLCGHRPLLTCSHSDGLQAKCIFSRTAIVSTHVTHHWQDGILVIRALQTF